MKLPTTIVVNRLNHLLEVRIENVLSMGIAAAGLFVAHVEKNQIQKLLLFQAVTWSLTNLSVAGVSAIVNCRVTVIRTAIAVFMSPHLSFSRLTHILGLARITVCIAWFIGSTLL